MTKRKPADETTRAVAYIRVSTDKQADKGVSLEAQEAKLRAYAGLFDIELVDVIVDGGWSAKTLDRPGLQRALALLKSGAANAILVTKLDRLTRSVRDLGDLVEAYFESGSALLSVSEHIDTRTAAGRLVLNVLGAVSQWEREAIGERTSAALQHKKSQGERYGQIPYGFALSACGERLEPHEGERSTLQTIAALRGAGASLRSIVDKLNTDGVPARGDRWHLTSVVRLLKGVEA